MTKKEQNRKLYTANWVTTTTTAAAAAQHQQQMLLDCIPSTSTSTSLPAEDAAALRECSSSPQRVLVRVNWAQGRLGMLWNWNTANRKLHRLCWGVWTAAKREKERERESVRSKESDLSERRKFRSSALIKSLQLFLADRQRGGERKWRCNGKFCVAWASNGNSCLVLFLSFSSAIKLIASAR